MKGTDYGKQYTIQNRAKDQSKQGGKKVRAAHGNNAARIVRPPTERTWPYTNGDIHLHAG
jgi:hypothetical protein